MSPPPTNIDGTDITGATIDGQDVQEITVDGQTVFVAEVLPTTVTSRPDDDSSAGGITNSRGLVVNPNSDFDRFGARISNNTSGVTRARLFDYSQAAFVETVDISGLTAGDAFTFSTAVNAGTDYGVEVDDFGGSYTIGFSQGTANYPFTGVDFDITAFSSDGAQNTNAGVQGVNDIGDVGL